MTLMNEGVFFESVHLRDRLIGWSILVGPLVVLFALGLIFLKPTPIAPKTVLGCYVADGSPSLYVQRGSIRIGEPEHRSVSYIAEPTKEGYGLAVEPALSLRPAGAGKYAFALDARGTGYFWPLLPKMSDDPRNLREPKDYGGRFQIIANDSSAVIYSRTSGTEKCE